MELFVIVFAVAIICLGTASLICITAISVINRDITYISYSPLSENDAEYGLRFLLFTYPNAVIDTPQNIISERLHSENSRVIIHQET